MQRICPPCSENIRGNLPDPFLSSNFLLLLFWPCRYIKDGMHLSSPTTFVMHLSTTEEACKIPSGMSKEILSTMRWCRPRISSLCVPAVAALTKRNQTFKEVLTWIDNLCQWRHWTSQDDSYAVSVVLRCNIESYQIISERHWWCAPYSTLRRAKTSPQYRNAFLLSPGVSEFRFSV